MSYNGSGTFLINTAGQPVVSGTVISSTAFNALTADLATGLSTAITKDGQTTVTANIPMGTYKFTGLGAGTAATDSANLSQVQSTVTKLLASVSGADTITAVASPTLGAYAAGQMFYFVAAGTNTGAVTLNIDSLGAKAVTRDGSTALTAGDLRSGEVIVVVYDGTRFQVVSQVNSGGDATFANVSITSALNVGGVATFTGNPVLSGGTANGVLYLNGSKVATSGSALVFDGTNLGIGTSSPAVKLDVQTASAVGGITLTATTGTNGAAINCVNTGGSSYFGRNNSSGGAFGGAAYATVVYGGGAYPMSFYTNDTERLRIDSSGNMGLAVTPDGNNLAKVFQLEQGFTMFGFSNTSYLSANAYYNSGWKYKSTAAAAYYEMSGANGHKWNIAASGTAGNTISFTTAMTLDASGNLGVGTTSPDQKLVVTGQQRILSAAASFTSTGVGLEFFYNSADNTGYLQSFDRAASVYKDMYIRADVVRFSSGTGTEAARITSGGYLLVGDTTHTDGSIFTGTGVTPLNAYRKSTTAAQGIFGCYSDTGGTKTVRAYFQVDGGLANYSANNVNLSDQRVKDNINPAGSYWNKIKALEIVTFRYKDQDENDQNIGVIAQQVETVAPEFVSNDGFGETPEGEEPLKTVYTTDMYHAAIKALQEAMARIEQLEAKVAALEIK